jgi:transposase
LKFPSWGIAEIFGGVPRLVVPDNLRSGVSRACRFDPDTNPSCLSLAEHYNTAFVPARAHKPQDKAKVEVGRAKLKKMLPGLIVCVTEKRTKAELDKWLQVLTDWGRQP